MSHVLSRVHTGTAAHAFLARAIANFEASCSRVARIVHERCPAVPLPTIYDATAGVIETDSAVLAEFFQPDCNATFVKEVATAVTKKFAVDKIDFVPSLARVRRVVGGSLSRAHNILSDAEKIAICTTLSKDAARALCERKLKARATALAGSIASL